MKNLKFILKKIPWRNRARDKKHETKKAAGARTQTDVQGANLIADWAADRSGGIRKSRDYLEVGAEVYCKTLLVRGWPSSIRPAEWIKPILREALVKREQSLLLPEGVSIRITLHYHPAVIKWDNATKRRIRRLERSVETAREMPGEAPDPQEVKALESIERLRESTLYDGSSVADVWCYISVFTEDTDTLYYSVKRIEEILRRLNISSARLPYEQTNAFLQNWAACAPDGEFIKKYPGRLVDEDTAAALMPFTHGSMSDGRGTYMGHRAAEETDRSSCFIDLIERDPEGNKNFIVAGASGEGKSTYLKALCDSLLLEGYLVIVFDVDGEYFNMCNNAGGMWIDHTLASGKYVDPFMIPPPLDENHPDPDVARMIRKENANRLEYVLNGVMRLASLLAGGLSPLEANAADMAIAELWDWANVDRDDPATWDRCRNLSIHHWYKNLKNTTNSPGARELSEKLWRFFEGAQGRMFSHAEEIDVRNANMVVFHVASTVNNETEAHAGAVKMSLALSTVWDAVKRNKVAGGRWSAVFFDEGQRILLDPNASYAVNTLATTIRKWNGLLVLATNKPGVLWPSSKQGGTEGGSGLWSNSAFKVLFWLEQSDMKAVQQNADLPSEVLNRLKGLHNTHSFVFRYLSKNAYDILRLELPDEERRFMKTRSLTGA